MAEGGYSRGVDRGGNVDGNELERGGANGGANEKHDVENVQTAWLTAWREGIPTMYVVDAQTLHTEPAAGETCAPGTAVAERSHGRPWTCTWLGERARALSLRRGLLRAVVECWTGRVVGKPRR